MKLHFESELPYQAAAIEAVYEHVAYNSGVERDFAEALELHEAMKVYAKLPGWFKVPTPLGSYYLVEPKTTDPGKFVFP